MKFRTSLLALGVLLAPWAWADDLPPVPTLVLIELAGGLDGLDAVPLIDPAYAKARPTLAVPADQLIRLNDQVALHPAFRPLMDSWAAGDFAIVQGVGYPDPNFSHFRSIAIWESGSASDEVLETGWVTRLFGAGVRWPEVLSDGLVLGETHPGPLKGPGMRVLSFDNLDAFLRDAGTVDDSDATQGAAGAIARVQRDVQAASQVLVAIKPRVRDPAAPFPETGLGRSMKLAFQLLAAGTRIPVIKLTLRGFDNHTNERAEMDRLLKELSGAVAAFRANALLAGLWDRVAVVTYSEFGRRVEENGSGGTDHGSAAPLFVWGGRVKGGLLGSAPSLTDLDHGNLKATIDFRTVFRSVVTEFWGVTDPGALSAAFPQTPGTIDLIAPATQTSGTRPSG